jgi:hypothetical protein
MSEKSEKDQKTFQSYLDNIKAKTGKTPDDFRALAAEKGLVKNSEIVNWLKTDFGLGHGHANAIAHLIMNTDETKSGPADPIAAHFVGKKAVWREPYDALAARIMEFGGDVEIAPAKSYINLVRVTRKFGIVQISAADRMDIGIKRKGVAPTERFEASGSWNVMVTHRVRIGDPTQIDAEVLAWLKQAYDAA